MKNHYQEVQYLSVSSEQVGRRLDNFLLTNFKNLPKSHLYRIVRKGEIRVNKKRASADYRLIEGDLIRIPPLYLETEKEVLKPKSSVLEELKEAILFENADLIILNKPSGLPVHGGTGMHTGGVIEALRIAREDQKFLELIHRLDRETSGCLLIAKRPSVLRNFHEMLRVGKMKKTYKTLTLGHWKDYKTVVDVALEKSEENGGGRVVKVKESGKTAITEFYREKNYEITSLMSVKLITGRTHQIRVHAAHTGHPLAGDEKYGDKAFNKMLKQQGLKRLFLHAAKIEFQWPESNELFQIEAPLPVELQDFLKSYK
jgi:23S rRNA pseudouridine955/2504/2580 synthase